MAKGASKAAGVPLPTLGPGSSSAAAWPAVTLAENSTFHVKHPSSRIAKPRHARPLQAPPESLDEPPIPVPEGARAFQLRKDGRAVSEFTSTGVERTRFELSKFTIAWISERWGGGEYHCQFRDSHGRSKGMQRFRLAGEPKAPPSLQVHRAERMPPPTALAPVDPLDMMLRIKGVADSEATRMMTMQGDLIRGVNEHATKMFELATARETSVATAGGERVARLEQAVLTLAQQIQTLVTSPRAVPPEDDEDEEEENDDEDEEEETRVRPGEGGVPSYPDEWDSFGKMAYRMIVRSMPALEAQVQQWLPALVADFVKKAQEKAAAAAAAAAAQNGAITVPPVVAP